MVRESASGPDAKSGLRAQGAKRGAGSVAGSRGGAGRARGHPHIRKPAPILPYPRFLILTGHPGYVLSRHVGGRTCTQQSCIQREECESNTTHSSRRAHRSTPAQQAAPRHKKMEGRLRRRRTQPRRPNRRPKSQVSPIPRKSGGVGRLLRRALGWPTGLQALRHAAAAPTRQEFELRKKNPSLAHRTTPLPLLKPYILY